MKGERRMPWLVMRHDKTWSHNFQFRNNICNDPNPYRVIQHTLSPVITLLFLHYIYSRSMCAIILSTLPPSLQISYKHCN